MPWRPSWRDRSGVGLVGNRFMGWAFVVARRYS
jgi:hypothetical protein